MRASFKKHISIFNKNKFIRNVGKLTSGLFYLYALVLVFITAFRQGIRAILMYVFQEE